MAFYRVTIWKEDGKVSQGIRELDNANVDYATNYFRGLAQKAGIVVYDIEAALLSNKCTAVREFIEAREKKRRNKNMPPPSGNYSPAPRRKDQVKNTGNWGENKKKE